MLYRLLCDVGIEGRDGGVLDPLPLVALVPFDVTVTKLVLDLDLVASC